MKIYHNGKKPIWGYIIIFIFLISFILGYFILRKDIIFQLSFLLLLLPFLFIWYKFIINYELDGNNLVVKGGVVGSEIIMIKEILYISALNRKEYKCLKLQLNEHKKTIRYMGDLFSNNPIIMAYINEDNIIDIIGLTPSNYDIFINDVCKNNNFKNLKNIDDLISRIS